ncbi:peptidyl-prolyl cis-trans isomerase [Paenibacillus whitsoniae]|nr:peptidyl-prolyl cis-trans isomerase [Paenibacillus whitsoniae]
MTTKKKDRKWIWTSSVLLAGFIAYIVVYPPVSASKAEKTIATVNGVKISSTQLYDAMVAGGGQQTLDSLINDELISQESKKAGIVVTDDDVNAELKSIQASFPSQEQFQQALTSYGMTIDDLKKNMSSQVMLKKILEPQITVTDDDIKKYYDENLETLKTPEQVQASHITVATKAEADALLAKLKSGSDFAALAKESSTDANTKDKGGELGYFSAGTQDAALEKAAFALKTGELSEPVQTASGYDIIKVTDHKAAATPTLDEKKDSIKQTLTEQKISDMSQTWLEQKKSEATIKSDLVNGV